MRDLLHRTLNYYHVTLANEEYQSPPIAELIKTAYAGSPIIGDRLRQGVGLERSCVANTIRDNKLGLEVAFLTYDSGYRPKKIEENLQSYVLTPEDIRLAQNEQIAEVVHLFIRNNHAVLESHRGAGGPGLIAKYLSWLIQRIDSNFPGIFFDPAPRPDVIEQMRKHRVKRLSLGVSPTVGLVDPHRDLYYTLSDIVLKTEARRAVLELTPTRSRYLKIDECEALYRESERTPVSAEIAFHLGNGTIIKGNDFKIKKVVRVPNDGTNNARSEDIFEAMTETYLEWVKDGYIQDTEMAPPG